jgi:outer membrane beta-barrel protein
MKGSFRSIVGTLVAVLLVLAATPAFAAEESKLDTYLDKYWGETRSVKVIQKRLFQKEGRLNVTPYFGVIPNDDFYTYYPMGAKVGYYFSEDLGVELTGSYIFGSESDLAGFLRSDSGFRVQTEFPQVLKWNAGLQGLWSPIHGKIGVFAWKLFHFDMHLSFGVGALGTEVSDNKGADKQSRTDVAGSVGLGGRVFVTDWAAIAVDYRHFFYAAMERLGGVSTPAEVTFGFSFFVN